MKRIQKEKITIMPTPPALLIRWMEAPELSKYDLSSLEVVLAGGARLNAEVAKKIKIDPGMRLPPEPRDGRRHAFLDGKG